ncbi:23S rRNA (uracil(1939)-C(5))-methyltransferase RlmD [bacterium]|nr:23S rRNA (uracil(1939)-C(5))-methyltransferase RlmD [bacterium]
MLPNDAYIVKVEKLVNDGFGIAHLNNKVIFIPKSIPEDVVEIRITHKKRKCYFAKVIKQITPSPLRKTSQCIHATSCGGCQYQDIDYPTQLKLKTAILSDTLTHSFPELNPILQAVTPCKQTQYYRNKMEFAFGKTAENKLTLGLKKQGHYDSVIPITDCQLLSAESNDMLTKSRQFFETSKLPLWDPYKQSGCLRHLGIRHSKAENTYMVNIIASTQEPIFNNYAAYIQKEHPNITSVNHIHIIEKTGQSTTTTCHHLAGDPHIIEHINTLKCIISPLSFFQTNSHQVGVLYDTIKNLVHLSPHQTLLDLYCGTGTIGLYASSPDTKLIGIEENPSAIENANQNAALNKLTHGHFFHGRVKNILKFEPIKADCVIVDPPRSGMVPKALKRTCELQAPELIYVSCNPVTLFRDLKVMTQHGYKVDTLIPVDMFPHTYHLECVAKLTLN